jgi:TonB family protein
MSPRRITPALVFAAVAWAASLSADEIPFEITLERSSNMRTGSKGIVVHLTPLGPGGARVAAGRVTISRAQDDTGKTLKQQDTGKFYEIAVGRIDNSKDYTSRNPTTFSLWGLNAQAKSFQIEGKMELLMPDMDPGSRVVTDDIAARFGCPLYSPELEKARVRIVVFDLETAASMAQAKLPDGPQDYDGGPAYGMIMPGMEALMNRHPRQPYMGPDDIAIGVSDPDSRLVSAEFQTSEGFALHYDHRASYHSGGTLKNHENRFEIYHLTEPLPGDGRLVCLLATDKAVMSIPLPVETLPLPDPGTLRSNAGVLTAVLLENSEAAKENLDYERSQSTLKRAPVARSLSEKIANLWADIPGYAALLKNDPHYDSLPGLVASVPPHPPILSALYGAPKVEVLVSFAVGPRGAVDAARVVESNDARYNQASLDAVFQWVFRPAILGGQPATAFIVVPFRFNYPVPAVSMPARAPSP